MKQRGLIVTGTRGAGKTTIVVLLSERLEICVPVPAVTTRPSRSDDRAGAYEYATMARFAELSSSGALFVEANYSGYEYGIEHAEVRAILARQQIPVMTITPKLAVQVAHSRQHGTWLPVFVDSPDELLDRRLADDGRPATQEDRLQRVADREFRQPPLVLVENAGAIETAVDQIEELLHSER
ncbi:hypothetical protein ACFQ05_11920 [Amycolatopsis umgeniensis]|uniref:Guanylate kinase n=1 Tax=Amycolatopsis umgeniensis TaxID=336628 RepID=A0A841B3V9_9PSEU|nr:hypothetical protein [Amycolatopsis umgeniensis]MBB5854007.1 guanylate kinase [Amycolatopsis umgeniensis]